MKKYLNILKKFDKAICEENEKLNKIYAKLVAESKEEGLLVDEDEEEIKIYAEEKVTEKKERLIEDEADDIINGKTENPEDDSATDSADDSEDDKTEDAPEEKPAETSDEKSDETSDDNKKEVVSESDDFIDLEEEMKPENENVIDLDKELKESVDMDEIDIEQLRNQSISSGTLDPDTLISKFVSVFKEYAPEKYDEYVQKNPDLNDLESLDDEKKSEIVDSLITELDKIAPSGTSFGAHPDDGADFGFWEVEDSSEEEESPEEIEESTDDVHCNEKPCKKSGINLREMFVDETEEVDDDSFEEIDKDKNKEKIKIDVDLKNEAKEDGAENDSEPKDTEKKEKTKISAKEFFTKSSKG